MRFGYLDMLTLRRLPQIRSIVERLSKNKRIKRRLPNGRLIYVSPDSQLKYMLKRFDTDLSSLADRFVTVDSVVWDIGANCGVFSFSCAAAQQIIAVEADPFLLSLLQESNRINNDIINIVSAAVFEDTKLVGFSIAHRGRASNHLSNIGGNSQSGGERSKLYVQTIALDSLLNSFLPPTLIKIDVEGAEVSVLKGSHKLLNIIKPIIYLETNENTHEDCRHILELAGYRLSREKDMNWLCTFIE